MAEDRRVQGYCFYDWGKSAFETSVTTAILPGWFTFLFLRANGLTTKILGTEWTADAIFSISVSVAAFIVAVMSPSFGVIADRRMIKMWWLRVLTYLGAGSTILLAAAPLARRVLSVGMVTHLFRVCECRSERCGSVLQFTATTYGF